MLGLFSKVTPYITKKKKNGVPHPRPDNTVFKLHYKVRLDLVKYSIFMNKLPTPFYTFYSTPRLDLAIDSI